MPTLPRRIGLERQISPVLRSREPSVRQSLILKTLPAMTTRRSLPRVANRKTTFNDHALCRSASERVTKIWR